MNKGKTIAQTITDRTDYAENPDKTRKGELVTSYGCSPRTADAEFLLSKQQYESITGRNQRDRNVLAYHICQSFKPGEIDAETANKIGYELAMRYTRGNNAFIVATHIDKSHIHNHIIFNSTNLDCMGKYKDPIGSYRIVRRISDQICVENGLSIIENPKPSKGHYGTWLGDNKKPNHRELLKQAIDDALAQKPNGFDDFLKLLESAGYEIKRRGNRHSFRGSGKGFLCLRSLKGDYTEEAIRERLSGKRIVQPKQKAAATTTKKFSLLLDVQNSIKAQNSPGYERWAKIFNLKQAAQTLIFIQENDITELDKLNEQAQQAKDTFNGLQSRIHAADSRMKEISELQKHIGAYTKTKDVYAEYKKSKFSKKFYAAHEKQIETCKAAKAYFDGLKLEKLPTMKSLTQEFAVLSADKKKCYSEFNQARKFMQDILLARQNVQQLLNYRDEEIGREQNRTER